MKKMKNLKKMSWLNYLFLSRGVRWKWYGGLEEGGREVLEGKEERKGRRADNELSETVSES